MSRLTVIGLGSPFSGDRIGWEIIDALQAEGNPMYELHKLDRPATQLLPMMQGKERVILIDALNSPTMVDSVIRLEPGQLQTEATLFSSHGFGVAEALRLAEAMHGLPERLTLLGVAADARAEECMAEIREQLKLQC